MPRETRLWGSRLVGEQRESKAACSRTGDTYFENVLVHDGDDADNEVGSDIVGSDVK